MMSTFMPWVKHYANFILSKLLSSMLEVGEARMAPMMHFKILKLEGLLQVTRSAHRMGVLYQYTSNITEHCHITLIKTPYCRSSC
jgi:hypothetical protein